jgi:hypothetical protein
MEYYFTYVGFEYTAKNKLQEAVQKLIVSNNRRIFTQDDCAQFRDNMIKEIEKLNEQYKRCKAVLPYWRELKKEASFYQHDDWHLSFQGEISLISFSIYGGKTNTNS